jgi:hypothetical protein
MYHHRLYFLETFVDTERFEGTSHRAAGWTYLGRTTGRGKADNTGKPNRSIKAVWGYALHGQFRRFLCLGAGLKWRIGEPRLSFGPDRCRGCGSECKSARFGRPTIRSSRR